MYQQRTVSRSASTSHNLLESSPDKVDASSEKVPPPDTIGLEDVTVVLECADETGCTMLPGFAGKRTGNILLVGRGGSGDDSGLEMTMGSLGGRVATGVFGTLAGRNLGLGDAGDRVTVGSE